jgi:hypothetical protein
MTTDYLATIDALVGSAARGLFGSHGLPIEPPRAPFEETPMDHDVACSIGFTAPEMHGAVVMTGRKDILARTWPAELRDREPSEAEICDWSGELVNQLLGRVKNALVPFGIALEQSTPTVVTGWHLHRAPASTTVARRYSFEVGASSIAIYFDAIVSEDFNLAESQDERPQSAVEGDVHLF